MKILVVDDSRTMRKIVRNALEAIGYAATDIVEASDGLEGLGRLREQHFKIDIVLADWNMPNMDGLTLLKRLQEDPLLKRIPVIMVTGEAQRHQVIEAIRAGARNYIVKPFTQDALRQKMLATEAELLARKKPTDTAIIRIESGRASLPRDSEQPFLAQLPEELVAGIYECARVTEHLPGELLMTPEAVVGALNIVDRGEVELLSAEDDGQAAPRVLEVRGQGDCIGETSFLSGDPAGLAARARTDVRIASVDKANFERLLAEHPHLSFFLTKLLAKCARKADAESAARLESGLSGDVSLMALAELVQTLHACRKTGLLRLSRPDQDGQIYFIDGNVRNADCASTSGEEAFYQLASWTEGRFTFEPGPLELEPGIFRATMSLLMEAMRRQDESMGCGQGRQAPPEGGTA